MTLWDTPAVYTASHMANPYQHPDLPTRIPHGASYRIDTHTTPPDLDPSPSLTHDPATPGRQFTVRTLLHPTYGLLWVHNDIAQLIPLTAARAYKQFHVLDQETQAQPHTARTIYVVVPPSIPFPPHGKRRRLFLLTGAGLDRLLDRNATPDRRIALTEWIYSHTGPISTILTRPMPTTAQALNTPGHGAASARGYYIPSEVTADLKLSNNTVYRWIARNYIHHIRTTTPTSTYNGAYLIPTATYQALLDQAPTPHNRQTAPPHYAAIFRKLAADPTRTAPYF